MAHTIASAYSGNGATIYRGSFADDAAAVSAMADVLGLSVSERMTLEEERIVQLGPRGWAITAECGCDRPDKHMRVQQVPKRTAWDELL